MAERSGAPERRVAIVAVDGGNSKTEVALVAADGAVLGVGWAGGSCHQTAGGVDRAVAAIGAGIAAAEREAGLEPGASREAAVGVFCLAGIDLPIDERLVRPAIVRAGAAQRVILRNDAFAGLRAGSTVGWGVSVVCGAGTNCVGVGPDGRQVRFAALGPLSGDRGGGGDLGLGGLGAAIRGGDGRGPRTVLERTVPAHFGLRTPAATLEAVYTGRIPERRLLELAPVVFTAASAGDAVAREIVDRTADEVIALAGAALRRLRLTRRRVEIVLAGGVFRAADPAFHERIRAGIRAVAPGAVLERLEAPPVIGAALIGADELGLGAAAEARIRVELTRARIGRRTPADG